MINSTTVNSTDWVEIDGAGKLELVGGQSYKITNGGSGQVYLSQKFKNPTDDISDSIYLSEGMTSVGITAGEYLFAKAALPATSIDVSSILIQGSTASEPTNLGTTYTATDFTITSSTGEDTTVDQADDTNAGAMSSADKVKLDGIATDATATNLIAGQEIIINESGDEYTINSTGVAYNVESDDDVTIRTNKVDGSIDIEANGNGSIQMNKDVIVPVAYRVQAGFFSTPDYLNAAGYGVRIGQNASGSWTNYHIGGDKVMGMGTGTEKTDAYGFDVFDASGNPKVGMGSESVIGEYGVVAVSGTNAVGMASLDSDVAEFQTIADGSITGKFDYEGNLTCSAGAMPTTNGTASQVLQSDGSGNIVWANGVGATVDLGTTYSATDVTITNSDGTNATISPTTATNSGVLTPTNLELIENAVQPDALPVVGATKITSLIAGTNITLTNGGGGAFTIASEAGAATDLGVTTNPSNVIITNTGGTDATIPNASGTSAGVMSSGVFKVMRDNILRTQFITGGTATVRPNSPSTIFFENDTVGTTITIDVTDCYHVTQTNPFTYMEFKNNVGGTLTLNILYDVTNLPVSANGGAGSGTSITVPDQAFISFIVDFGASPSTTGIARIVEYVETNSPTITA